MNKEEVIIINDELFYRILNGTSYDYAPIPKEFKPYFERLEQENQHLKENNKSIMEELLKVVGLYNQQKSVLDEIREYIERQEVNSIGSFFADTPIGKDLLQILDKVKE